MNSGTKTDIIILAAGQGTRMKSALPKVLHPVGGKTLISHVLDTASEIPNAKIHVVIGNGADELKEHVVARHQDLDVNWVLQAEQLGTGHAVQQALPSLNSGANALILYGDVPLISSGTLIELLALADERQLGLLTAELDDPATYGRIVRDDKKQVAEIVEARDCDANQLEICEINTGFMAAPVPVLSATLDQLENHNDQNEYYLTDVIKLAREQGCAVSALCVDDQNTILGVNSRTDLAVCEKNYQLRRAAEYMDAGVTIVDPARVTFRGEIEIGSDTTLDINTVIEGPGKIGSNTTIGANSIVRGSMLADGCTVEPNCVIESADIHTGATIGPFARIRPGASLGENVRIGNFVEVKNSTLAASAKANHLAYVGDSDVGAGTNIGAGVITCNYDGANKHRTVIGENVFVGSDCQLVAPVTIGDNATIGAGSTVTSDVEAGTLAISRSRQRAISGWQRPSKKTGK